MTEARGTLRNKIMSFQQIYRIFSTLLLVYLDAWCDWRPALLVSPGAPVALPAGDAVLARTLPRRLVADLARRAHRVAVAGRAGALVRDVMLGRPEVSLLAVVAVPAGRVVPAPEADAAGDAARQLVQLHVEPAAARVVVAVAGHALVGRVGRRSTPRTVKVKALLEEKTTLCSKVSQHAIGLIGPSTN